MNGAHFNLQISAPISLHGEGTYAMSAVKEIRVTEDYLGKNKKMPKSGII